MSLRSKLIASGALVVVGTATLSSAAGASPVAPQERNVVEVVVGAPVQMLMIGPCREETISVDQAIDFTIRRSGDLAEPLTVVYGRDSMSPYGSNLAEEERVVLEAGVAEVTIPAVAPVAGPVAEEASWRLAVFGDDAYEVTQDSIQTVIGTVGADPDQALPCPGPEGEGGLHGDYLEPDGDLQRFDLPFCGLPIEEPYDRIPEADRDGDPATPVVDHASELADEPDGPEAKVAVDTDDVDVDAPAEPIEAEPVAETTPELPVARAAGVGILAVALGGLTVVTRRTRKASSVG